MKTKHGLSRRELNYQSLWRASAHRKWGIACLKALFTVDSKAKGWALTYIFSTSILYFYRIQIAIYLYDIHIQTYYSLSFPAFKALFCFVVVIVFNSKSRKINRQAFILAVIINLIWCFLEWAGRYIIRIIWSKYPCNLLAVSYKQLIFFSRLERLNRCKSLLVSIVVPKP